MVSRAAVLWAGAATAAAAAVGGGLYWTLPGLVWPDRVPIIAGGNAPPPPAARHPAQAPSSAPVVAGAAKLDAASAPAPQTEAKPAASAPVKPAFDVVNVDPTGETVVAGRAAPNAQVALLDAGKTVAETKADAGGSFVIIPPALAPGAHTLSLASGEAGAPLTSVAIPVAVPEPPPKAAIANAASAPQAPAPVAEPPRIAVQSVESGAGGRIAARGVADPNSTVRLYLSGAFVGDAKTGADGKWSLTIRHGVTPGPYALRADEINPADASVVARAEAPFDYAAPSASEPGAAVADAGGSAADVVVDSVLTHHVEHGNTLWGISQKFYGDGSRYQLIYAANTNQIRNPNLIYPGQTFVVPKNLKP